MKKKLTVNALALSNLKQRRRQYTIMIIGIILSMVFSSSIIFFMLSANETYNEKIIRERGRQDAIVYANGFGEEDYKTAVEDDILTDYGFAHIIGYAYSDPDSLILGSCVAWLDDKAKDISNFMLLEGNYPTAENEIAAEESALRELGFSDAEIGDTIKLKLDVQNDSERLKTVEKEYVLTGIVSDKKSNLTAYNSPGDPDIVPAVFVAENTKTEPGGREQLVAYVYQQEVDEGEYTENGETYYLDSNIALRNYFSEKTGGNYIIESGLGTGVSHFASLQVFSFSADYILIIAAVMILASGIAIINSFSTNLKDRKKQIGMLRAVGATRRQIVGIFGREAFIISIVCAPVSIALSCGIVKILLTLFTENGVMFKNPAAIPAAAVIDIGIVMLAVMLPLASAAKISPMQAIRNISVHRKAKTKKIKSKKQFKVPALVAKRNLQFYSGGRIAVSVIMAVMIILSCFGFSLLQYSKNHQRTFEYDYSIVGMEPVSVPFGNNGTYVYRGMDDTGLQDIAALPYVEKVSPEKQYSAAIELEEFDDYSRILQSGYVLWTYSAEISSYDEIKESLLSDEDSAYMLQKGLLGTDNEILGTDLFGFSEEKISDLEEFVVSGEINYEKIASGEEIILVAPSKVQYMAKISSRGYGTYILCDDDIKTARKDYKLIADAETPFKAGDKINVFIYPANYEEPADGEQAVRAASKEVTIGAVISPNSTDGENGFYIYNSGMITSLQGFSNLFPEKPYSSVEIKVNGEINDELNNRIMSDLETIKSKYNGFLYSYYEATVWEQKSDQSFFAALLAIILIGFMVCTGIINSTISAQIRENKRVIGTLRAVGANESDFIKSYLLQLLSMFKWGAGIGFGGFAAAYCTIWIITKYFSFGTFEFEFCPWPSAALAVIIFAVCAVNIRLKVRREMKNSIVENIREL